MRDMRGVIQIAGVLSMDEARMLAEEGAHHIGFPLRLPVHREDLSEDDAARVICELDDPIRAVLITYLVRSAEIIALCGTLGVRKVQVHSSISVEEVKKLRRSDPGLLVIKSLVVRGGNLPELENILRELSPYVDAFITDTFDPATGASGATGMVHDWEISRRLVQLSSRPVILAGGLTPGNVRDAILHVRPAGVDVHTGVEAPDGRKDRRLVRLFVSEAQRAFADAEH